MSSDTSFYHVTRHISERPDENENKHGKNEFLKKIARHLKIIRTPHNLGELTENIHLLEKFCLEIKKMPTSKIGSNRNEGYRLLCEMLPKLDTTLLQTEHIMILTWSTVSLINYYHSKLKLQGSGCIEYRNRRRCRSVIKNYENLCKILSKDFNSTLIVSLVAYFVESHMWPREFMCVELLKKALVDDLSTEKCIYCLLTLIEEKSVDDIKVARQIMRVLYGILEMHTWIVIKYDLLDRIIEMFHQSIMPSENVKYNYIPLRKGLEVCVRRLLENIPNNNLLIVIQMMIKWTLDERLIDECLLDFGNVLEYAALLHNTLLYKNTLTPELFPMVLQLIASDNRLLSLLGNRILQHLLDRHKNRLQFDTPRIYFQNSHFNIVIGEYHPEDKLFYKQYRSMIHDSLLASISQHGVHRLNLDSLFCTIALFIVEIPCGYTAAAVVCLGMNVQECVLADEFISLSCAHRVHATIMSLMSLVCWVHNAKVFYDYLNELIGLRAQMAPHLNPPLMASYQYAHHHVLWNKKELFFDDWEVRYGLWKCFKTENTDMETANSTLV